MTMEMMANNSMDPSFDPSRLILILLLFNRRTRDCRSTQLRHCMGKGGTEFTVCQTKNSLGLPIIFRLIPAT